jgi:GNAT superfamily N-acetyltransferase
MIYSELIPKTQENMLVANANKMRVVLADSRHVWRIIDYLQRDAASKGAKKTEVKNFGSFWNNMEEFMPAFHEKRLYVVLDTRKRLLAYFIARWGLDDGREGALPIDIFEVLPKYRKRGVGSFMVSWLEDKACTAGFHSIEVRPANGSNAFWENNGFGPWTEKMGFLVLPVS